MTLDSNLKAVHKYRKSEKGKQTRKKHYTENREKLLLWQKQHYQENKERIQAQHGQYYLKNREDLLETTKKYQKTDKGKSVSKKAGSKYYKTEKGKAVAAKKLAKRKRNLGWIQMFDNPFNDKEQINWHHVTDAYVVALPKDLHQLYYGKNHRENTMEIVKQIYGG